MYVYELIEYLLTLDGNLEVEIGDSNYPPVELKKENICIESGRVVLY